MRELRERGRGGEQQVHSSSHSKLTFDGSSRDVLTQVLVERVRKVLSHRSIVGDPRRILTDVDLHRLEGPLVQRMQQGLLSPELLIGFVSGIANGGICLAEFVYDPCIPMELDDSEAIRSGRALPRFLSEREVDPIVQFSDCSNRQKIAGSILKAARQVDCELPVYFLGSAAAGNGLSSDIDIGTSLALMGQHLERYGQLFQSMRGFLAEAKAFGNRNHVGAQFDHMALALGVSVFRYGCAYRFSGQQAFVIEAATE